MRTRELAEKAVRDGGITIDPETNDPAQLTAGFLVGIGRLGESLFLVEESAPNVEHYRALNALLDLIPIDAEDLYVGAWTDNGIVYWELSQWFPTWDRAMIRAISGRQKSFWDVANSEAIPAYNDGGW